jgi:hypothetical protein
MIFGMYGLIGGACALVLLIILTAVHRYFNEVVDYDTRLDTLKHMVRAWLQTTSKEGIETWIAHGTLLGWWWNAKVLALGSAAVVYSR